MPVNSARNSKYRCNDIVVATIQGVNQAQGMYQTSKGYISAPRACIEYIALVKYGFSGR